MALAAVMGLTMQESNYFYVNRQLKKIYHQFKKIEICRTKTDFVTKKKQKKFRN